MVVLGATASCTDTVYRDRPGGGFVAPPEAAAGFLGFSQEDTKQTVCGNCHVGQQTQWASTAHADAWATLEASGHAQDFCRECHSVNQKGNTSDVQGGWVTTKDTRYHDVQCESCHGPGINHVEDPSAKKPLAPLGVSIDTSANPPLTYGCGDCHNGVHHPYVEQWAMSPHAMASEHSKERQAEAASCGAACHTGQGALERNLTKDAGTNYVEKVATITPQNALPITCAVCHDPHEKKYEGQLRVAVNGTVAQENLCANCHNRRGSPSGTATSDWRGPHAPEWETVDGTAGWWPPSLGAEVPLKSTHGSEKNPNMCATCHVRRFDVTDSTGASFTSVGHLFLAIPCLDASGKPTADNSCALAATARDFGGCAGAGCHAPQSAAGALVSATVNTTLLLETLEELFARIPCSEFDPNDGKWTVAEGAHFNYQLAAMRSLQEEIDSRPPAGAAACAFTVSGSTVDTRAVRPPEAWTGQVVHSPFLIQALLAGSIREIKNTYGLSASAAANAAVNATLAKARADGTIK
ncbi:MAG TPA: multiheme c-type cytochrome [Gemmatimonadaceae bacterium]|nr:multiheme c-type cytochrome [Gemmatimonadaceae bacterium]